MAASAPLTGNLSLPSPRLRDGRDREAILVELEGELVVLRRGLAAFLEAPSDLSAREQLTNGLRKSAAEASALDWAAIASSLSRAEAVVKSAGVLGYLEQEESDALEVSLDRLSEALHGDREQTPASGPQGAVVAAPEPRRETQVLSVSVFVAGPRAVADTLRARGAVEGDGYAFAVRHHPRLASAFAAIRAAEPRPEVVLVDGDEPGAEQLVEDLLGDARTDAVPVVVVGTWHAPEHAARFVALGAARCVAKPLAAGELRRVCAQVSPGAPSVRFEPLGSMSLDDLGARLASELHANLCDAAIDDRTRRKLVELGDGSAVLTVMWDAVARIRELVSAQTAGDVRFKQTLRDEALPGGVSLTRASARDKSERALGVERSSDAAPLGALTVLVAEDDLTTNWFLSGVLRGVGATVVEAFSAEEAMDRARETLPDAVVAGLGLGTVAGRSLARALGEDVVLRDVPVVVLGADTVQLRRAEELGEAGVGAILRGASADTVTQRLREVTRSRRTLAARFAAGGRVQGRLDDLTPLTLLRLAARETPNGRVTVHGGDAVLEIEFREGHPVRACRTAADGSLRHGGAALAALLAVGAGRFLVEPSEQPVVAEFEGSLTQVLAEPIDRIRRLQRAMTGAALFAIERVAFDAEAIAGLVPATPEPARTVLAALITGRAPRALVLAGDATLDLVERVLIDVTRRNGIVHFDRGDAEALAASAPALLDVTPVPEHVMPTAERVAHRVAAPPLAVVQALMASPPPPAVLEDARRSAVAVEAPADLPPAELGFDGTTEAFELPVPEDASWVSPMARVSTADVRDSAVDAEPVFEPIEDDAPSSSRAPAPVASSASHAPRARASSPALAPSFARPVRGAHTPILVSRLAVSQEAPRRSATPILSSAVREGARSELAMLDTPARRPDAKPGAEAVASVPSLATELPCPPQEQVAVPAATAVPAAASAVPAAASAVPAATAVPAAASAVPELPKAALPSSFVPRTPAEVEAKPSTWRYLAPAIFAVVGVSLAVGARWWRYQELSAKSVSADAVAPPSVPPADVTSPLEAASPEAALAAASAEAGAPPADAKSPTPEATAAPTQDVAPSGAKAEPEEAPIETPLSPKERRKVDEEHGIVEIVAGRKDEIFIDGKRLGSGPTQRARLSANGEKHEVRVKMRGEERVRYVTAKPGVKLRYRVAPPWSH